MLMDTTQARMVYTPALIMFCLEQTTNQAIIFPTELLV